jgi:peptidoglycan biosynthesis protein MviN/MurJ (putative lipid II flippase)
MIGPAMQIISVLIGLICALFLVPGLIPLFGWLQWAVLAGCVLGIIFGSFCQRKIGLTILKQSSAKARFSQRGPRGFFATGSRRRDS